MGGPTTGSGGPSECCICGTEGEVLEHACTGYVNYIGYGTSDVQGLMPVSADSDFTKAHRVVVEIPSVSDTEVSQGSWTNCSICASHYCAAGATNDSMTFSQL